MAKQHRLRELSPTKGGHSGALVRANRDPVTINQEGSIRIDLEVLGPPTNVYDADLAWVVERFGAVSLFFGKLNNPGADLRNRVEIRYGYEPFVEHFWKNSRGFHERLRSYLAGFHEPPHRETFDPSKLRADKDFSDWANFEVISHAGTQASLDFFRLPPSGLARFVVAKTSSGLVVDPILRVHTTAAELCALFDACEPIVARIKGYLPP